MPTETEDSKNNQYIFKYNNEAFSQTITYMKNVVEEIQKKLKAKDVKLDREADEKTSGPEYIILKDPDGNPILIDQHR